MPAITNQAHVLFDGLDDLTIQAGSAITGRRFCTITGVTSGPGLASTAEGSNLTAVHSTAAARTDGVARYDIAATSGVVGSLVRSGSIVQVDASATISAGAEVEVASGGKTAALSSGVAVGRAITAGANNATHYVLIY